MKSEVNLYNKKGTLSREVLNTLDYNKKSDKKLLYIAALSNAAGCIYMMLNDIPDIPLTVLIRNGVNILSLSELVLLRNDYRRKNKSMYKLNELFESLKIEGNLYDYMPLCVFNDEKDNSNYIISDDLTLKEYIEDGKYKCEFYTDLDSYDVTDKVENLTGGVKKLKQNK